MQQVTIVVFIVHLATHQQTATEDHPVQFCNRLLEPLNSNHEDQHVGGEC